MAENPLATIARVVGGVVLMEGHLGHQVLGQLLVMNTNEVGIAGASAVVAATSGQRNVVGQIVLRTAVPALAVRAILRKTEERIDRKASLLAEREAALGASVRAAEQRARAQALTEATRQRQQHDAAAAAAVAAAAASTQDAAQDQVATLRKDKSALKGQLTRLRNRLRRMQEEAARKQPPPAARLKKPPKKRRR